MTESDNNPSTSKRRSSVPSAEELTSEAFKIWPPEQCTKEERNVRMNAAAILVLAETIEAASHRIASAISGRSDNSD